MCKQAGDIGVAPSADEVFAPFGEPGGEALSPSESDLGQMLHELRQPLNNIQLAAILLRNRTAPLLQSSELEYFMRRIERITGQVVRAVEIASKISQSSICKNQHE